MPTTRIKTFFRTYFSTLSIGLILFLAVPMPVKAAGEIDPTFNAGAFKEPRGSATTVVAQPDGKVLIGGSFEIVNGFLRNSLARVNPNGSADTTFNPPPLIYKPGNGISSSVEAIALQADGKIIVAGNFRITDLNLRAPIVRLNTDGSLDSSFNFAAQGGSALNGVIKDVEIRADGKIFIAGSFVYTSPGGGVRTNLARLNADGSTDETFNPPGVSLPIDDIAVQPDGKVVGFVTPGDSSGFLRFLKRLMEDGSPDTSFKTLVSDEIYSIKIQPDGKIVLGGNFYGVNNVYRLLIARVHANGLLDETFTSPFPSAYFIGRIYEIEIAGDGKLFAAGSYFHSSGPAAGLLFRLNENGSFDSETFNSYAPNYGRYIQIFDLAFLANGQIMIAGNMTQPEFVLSGGFTGAGANRLNANHSYDTAFRTLIGIRGNVLNIAPLTNGQIVIGGDFNAVNRTIRRPGISRLTAAGILDTRFDPAFIGMFYYSFVRSVTPLADNRVFAGGLFLERLNLDGSEDPTFNASIPSAVRFNDIAVQPDGKVIAVGQSIPYQGDTCCVLRFNADGSLDSSFQFPGLGGASVKKVLIQPDGKILIGGQFSRIGYSARSSIARLDADGSLDTSFNPVGGASGIVADIALQPDGKVLISGEFSQVNGVGRQGIARLNADGSLDATFDAAANSPVFTVELQTDGKILVGGAFTSIGGAARNRIARLNPNGSIDSTFDVGAGADGNVHVIALDTSGRVLAGGEFVRYDNTPKAGIVRLLNDIAPQATPFEYDAKSGQVKNYNVGDEFSLFAPGQQSFRLHYSEYPENIIYSETSK